MDQDWCTEKSADTVDTAAALQAAAQRASAAFQEQQAQQAQEAARNPFNGWPFNTGAGGSRGRSQGSAMQGSAPAPYQAQQSSGPVIDAEFWSIDESDE